MSLVEKTDLSCIILTLNNSVIDNIVEERADQLDFDLNFDEKGQIIEWLKKNRNDFYGETFRDWKPFGFQNKDKAILAYLQELEKFANNTKAIIDIHENGVKFSFVEDQLESFYKTKKNYDSFRRVSIWIIDAMGLLYGPNRLLADYFHDKVCNDRLDRSSQLIIHKCCFICDY